MRTTVTLDDDVATRLKRVAHEQSLSFKQVLNESVRRGLDTEEREAVPVTLATRSLGARPGISLDRALSLAGQLEDAETVRRLSLRK